eukprot:TRINITY_DN638_c0_g2_i2.p2 TRINITY_DN638_c0_g2~~TRINITY_DN638_c0_g2_i2.p2  ORF type:complete len:273 (-),score=42.07 TRINITY_DN638_c0_g2_i2:2322-3140(-)
MRCFKNCEAVKFTGHFNGADTIEYFAMQLRKKCPNLNHILLHIHKVRNFEQYEDSDVMSSCIAIFKEMIKTIKASEDDLKAQSVTVANVIQQSRTASDNEGSEFDFVLREFRELKNTLLRERRSHINNSKRLKDYSNWMEEPLHFFEEEFSKIMEEQFEVMLRKKLKIVEDPNNPEFVALVRNYTNVDDIGECATKLKAIKDKVLADIRKGRAGIETTEFRFFVICCFDICSFGRIFGFEKLAIGNSDTCYNWIILCQCVFYCITMLWWCIY